jgi:hypothetical protein
MGQTNRIAKARRIEVGAARVLTGPPLRAYLRNRVGERRPCALLNTAGFAVRLSPSVNERNPDSWLTLNRRSSHGNDDQNSRLTPLHLRARFLVRPPPTGLARCHNAIRGFPAINSNAGKQSWAAPPLKAGCGVTRLSGRVSNGPSWVTHSEKRRR